MTRDDTFTTDPTGAAQHQANHAHHIGRSAHARAREAGITVDDVPFGDGPDDDPLGWWAGFLAARGGGS